MCPLPQNSLPQLSSADNLAGADLSGKLSEDTSASSVNSLTPCNCQSSGIQMPLDLERQSSSLQANYAFLQGSQSPMGMDHSESFMDPDSDLVEIDFADHFSIHMASPSNHNSYAIIQTKQAFSSQSLAILMSSQHQEVSDHPFENNLQSFSKTLSSSSRNHTFTPSNHQFNFLGGWAGTILTKLQRSCTSTFHACCYNTSSPGCSNP